MSDNSYSNLDSESDKEVDPVSPKFEIDENGFDLINDPFNAFYNDNFEFIDHSFNIDTSDISFIDNTNHECLFTKCEEKKKKKLKNYFDSIDCDDVVSKMLKKQKYVIKEVTKYNQQVYFLIEADGDKHMVTNSPNIIPIQEQQEFYMLNSVLPSHKNLDSTQFRP
ncbi:hypothetical protein M9Y10_011256 [Tritrichomonas musculus]|uniref:Uncharacterized protein n=1 Tax=Tritrichomonas musculus TaxID=1915356 RepID=A0ABR2IKI6_9EUKA